MKALTIAAATLLLIAACKKEEEKEYAPANSEVSLNINGIDIKTINYKVDRIGRSGAKLSLALEINYNTSGFGIIHFEVNEKLETGRNLYGTVAIQTSTKGTFYGNYYENVYIERIDTFKTNIAVSGSFNCWGIGVNAGKITDTVDVKGKFSNIIWPR